MAAAAQSVFRVLYNDGAADYNALVFDKPVQGKAYGRGEMIVFGSEGQSSHAAANDDGVIPHREPGDGPQGITWSFAK